MASGRSLELAAIKPESHQMCSCGEPYVSHWRKDRKGLLKKFQGGDHLPLGRYGVQHTRKNKLTKAERRAHKRRVR